MVDTTWPQGGFMQPILEVLTSVVFLLLTESFCCFQNKNFKRSREADVDLSLVVWYEMFYVKQKLLIDLQKGSHYSSCLESPNFSVSNLRLCRSINQKVLNITTKRNLSRFQQPVEWRDEGFTDEDLMHELTCSFRVCRVRRHLLVCVFFTKKLTRITSKKIMNQSKSILKKDLPKIMYLKQTKNNPKFRFCLTIISSWLPEKKKHVVQSIFF